MILSVPSFSSEEMIRSLFVAGLLLLVKYSNKCVSKSKDCLNILININVRPVLGAGGPAQRFGPSHLARRIVLLRTVGSGFSLFFFSQQKTHLIHNSCREER